MASVLDTFEAHDSRLAPFDIKISKDANPNVIANELVNKGSILDTFEKPLGEAPIKSPVQDTTVVKPQVNVEAYDPLSMFGKLAPKAPLKPPKLFDGVVSISKSDNKPNFLERGLNALTDLFGLDNVGKLSEGAKAQALVMHMAKEEGIPLDQYRQSPELIEKAASSFISMSTLGLAPAIKKTLTGEVEYPATNTLGYIGEAVGSLAGLYGAPIQIAGRFVKPVLSFLPEAVQSEAVSARVLKSALRDSVLLGPAIGLSNVGEALEQTTFTEAADKIWEGIKSGAMIGTIFGTAKGLFPKEGIETGARIFSGLIGLNAYRASQVGGNPFTKRPMGDVLFDIALDSLFLYKGLPKNMRFEVAKDLDNLNDKIDQAKKPPPPSGGGGGIPDKVIQQALSRVSDVEKAQIELEAKRIEDKAKIAIQAKADLEVKGKEIEDIKESYEVDDLIKDGRAKIVEPGTRIKSDLELAKEEGIKKIEEGPKDELVKSLNELGYDEQDIAGMEEGQRQLIISQGIRRNKVDIKQPKSDIKQETVQPEAKKEIERLNAEREYLNELQTTHNRLISGGATELEFRNEVTMRGSASNKPLHKGETWRSRNEAYIKLIEDRVRRLESVKTKSILRKKKVEKEPITDVDLQTGTPLPEKLSSNKHPFRNADKAQTNEMSKLYIEKIRNKDIDPEVFTQYLINEVNRYLNGEEPSTPIEKIRNGLSNAAANAENARLKFDTRKDFLEWKDTVTEAARWARESDRSNGTSDFKLTSGIDPTEFFDRLGRLHPATFPVKAQQMMADIAKQLGITDVLDIFGGIGKIGGMKKYGYEGRISTNEIEPNWGGRPTKEVQKENGVDLTTIGDSRKLKNKSNSVEAIFTSPTYGNTMALKSPSKKDSYQAFAGGKLDEGNTGGEVWGPRYEELHKDIYKEAFRVVKPGGYFVLNMKDKPVSAVNQKNNWIPKKGSTVTVEDGVMKATDWHIKSLEAVGFKLISRHTFDESVAVDKRASQKFGRKFSVGYEDIVVMQKPLDRLTNKRTGGTQLNMFIPVNELPEQVKGLLKSIKAIVRSKPADLIKASRLGGPRDVIKRYLDGLDTEEEARAKGMTGQLAEDYGDWTRPSPTIYRNKEIFDATGFWLGKDGKWRYEISDYIDIYNKDNKVRFQIPKESRRMFNENGFVSIPLKEMYTNDALYTAVPEAKDIFVRVDQAKQNAQGSYDPRTKSIDMRFLDDRETLIHELQHAVNDIVGSKFKGSNVQEQEMLGRIQLFKQLRDAVKDSEIKKEITDLIYEAPKSNKSVHELTYDLRVKAIQKSQEDFITIEQALHDYGKTSAFENYMKDPGEMEARLASARMEMTAEKRKKTPPWETLDSMLLDEDVRDRPNASIPRTPEKAGLKLYSGIDPTQFSEATKKIIEGAKALARYTAKARGVKEFKPGVALTRAREEFIHSGIDRSGNIRRDLLDQLGNEGYEIIQKMYLSKGASSLAAQQLKQMRNEVYAGLSKDDKRILDNLILADRMLDIGKYKTAAQFKFPEGLTPTEAASYNELFQFTEGITAEKASLLKQRSQAYFEWMKKPLKDMLDAELISQTEYDALSSHNYRRLKLVDIFDSRYQSKIGKKTRTVYDSGVEALSHGRDTDVFEPSSEVMALEVFNRAYGRILNNAANRTLLDLARTQKDNPFVAVKESPNDIIPSGWNRVFVYEKGERKAIYLSPEMAKEWITNNPDMSYKLSQFIRYASGSPVLRTFATGIDWGFALANLPRDIMHIWYAARVFEKGEWKPLYNSNMPIYAWQMGRDIEGVFNDAMLRKGTYTDYIKEGGGMEFLVHQGRLMQRGRHIEGNIDKIQDFLGYLGETSEIMTRLAIRDRVIKRRAAELGISYEEAYKNKKITQEATFAARDYMDFGQGGGITKALDNGIPYLNASVQGTRGLFRAFKDNPVQSTYKLAQFAALVTGLYIANQSLNPKTMESLKGNIDMQGNLIIPLGDGFGFLDEKGQQRYPYFKIPLDPGQKFFKTFFEASYDKATGQTVDVNAVTNSLSQTSPVAISSLPPTVSGTLGYLYNKDFWKNEEIWKKTDKPLGWPNSKEEYIPGQTPQGLIDVGSVTGMSPERLKYALSELVTGGSMWSWLVGQGYDAAFKDISPDKKEQHLAEALSKIPIIKRFFGVTNSYSQFAEPINEAREDSMLKRWIENRGLDQRVDSFLFEGGKRSDVIDYIKVTAKDQDTQDRLKERFIFSEKIKDLPNRSFWLSLKGIPDTEARAKVFVQRLDAASEVDRAAIMREVGIVQHAGGVISDKFKQDVMKFRDSRNKTTP